MHAILVRDGRREEGKWQGVNKAGLVGRDQIMKLDSVLKPVCLLLPLLGKFLSQTFTYIIPSYCTGLCSKIHFSHNYSQYPLHFLTYFMKCLSEIYACIYFFCAFYYPSRIKYQEDKDLISLVLTCNGAWHMVTA